MKNGGENLNKIIIVLFVFLIGLIIISFIEKTPTIDTVSISQSLVNFLNERFSIDTTNFVYCAEGKVEGNKLIITRLFPPEFSEFTSEQHIISQCDKKTITTIHSHKNKVCAMSVYDAYSLGALKHPTMGIICDVDRMVFYTPQGLEESIIMEVK